jgi:PAS domain S-box-containing protein
METTPIATTVPATNQVDEAPSEAQLDSTISNKALRISEIRYRRLFETALDGIMIINASSGQIEDANPFLLKMLEYSHDELLNRKLWEVGPFKDIEQTKEMFLELQENGYVRYDYLPLKTKTGKLVEVEFVSNSYDVENVRVIQCNIRDISERKAAENISAGYNEQLKTALMNTVEVATIISEMRDPYTAGHERRVGQIARDIGEELGLDEKMQEGLMISGYLHDIGKVGIPSEILSKPGRISSVELLLIQGHAQASYDILHRMKWPWPVAEIALQHHEHIDGTGYPNGLKDKAILLEAKIIAVADTVEAMSSHRPYRAALGIDKALDEIQFGRGRKYDPLVVDSCISLFKNKGYQLPQ